MASSSSLLLALKKFSFLSHVFRWDGCLIPVKHYSLYPKSYLKPISKKETLQTFSEEEIQKYKITPVRPAPAVQTCSSLHDPLLEKFTHILMRKGNRELAVHLMSKTFFNIKMIQFRKYMNETDEEKKKQIVLDPLKIFHTAIENCTPALTFKTARRGGINYKVPTILPNHRGLFKCINWIIVGAADKDAKKRFTLELAEELLNASECSGKAYTKKIELYKQCESNRAYAHYQSN